MMHGFWGGPMGFGWAGGLFMAVFWILLIVGLAWLVRYLVGFRTCYPGRHETPLEILRNRYAKGEIDKKEFEEKKKDLSR
jgi:putative membrane protein